jgi:class 3 adenylate cyclase
MGAGGGALVRTFLIADIRGYSTFTRERGDATAARLATRFAELARDSVEARGGMVIELRGDEALAVFDSTVQAVRAALELQEACREATAEDPELPVPVGVGIDAGEAIPVEDGYRGRALNLAARLCAKAAAGQVLLSRYAADAVDATQADDAGGPGPGIRLEPRGSAELKGFEGPVELLEVVRSETAPRRSRVLRILERSLPSSTTTRRSLGVSTSSGGCGERGARPAGAAAGSFSFRGRPGSARRVSPPGSPAGSGTSAGSSATAEPAEPARPTR